MNLIWYSWARELLCSNRGKYLAPNYLPSLSTSFSVPLLTWGYPSWLPWACLWTVILGHLYTPFPSARIPLAQTHMANCPTSIKSLLGYHLPWLPCLKLPPPPHLICPACPFPHGRYQNPHGKVKNPGPREVECIYPECTSRDVLDQAEGPLREPEATTCPSTTSL